MIGKIGLTGVLILVVLAILFVPALTVWVINSLAESGGSSFRLAHGLWNYFLIVLGLGLVRGGTR